MSQFPRPWKAIEGNYARTCPSRRFQINVGDIAKVAATTILLQPFVLATSGGIE
jgi:hypothetical protein